MPGASALGAPDKIALCAVEPPETVQEEMTELITMPYYAFYLC